MTVADTAKKFRLHGCRLSMKEIETEIMSCKTLVMPPIQMITPNEYNFMCNYLKEVKELFDKDLKSIPENI